MVRFAGILVLNPVPESTKQAASTVNSTRDHVNVVEFTVSTNRDFSFSPPQIGVSRYSSRNRSNRVLGDPHCMSLCISNVGCSACATDPTNKPKIRAIFFIATPCGVFTTISNDRTIVGWQDSCLWPLLQYQIVG
jgi:hypothetical protein